MDGRIPFFDEWLGAHPPVEAARRRLLPEGASAGGWTVGGLLGRGANGEVYHATRVSDGAGAALKIPIRSDPSSVRRFRREADFLRDHPHPALPRFLDAGELPDGRPWAAIEELERRPLPSGDRAVARFVRTVGSAAAHLHATGLVHRDVKPSNVLFRPDGSPVLIDLGLVKWTAPAGGEPAAAPDGVSTLSVVDGRAVGVGTPGFSAPEQFAGGGVSPSADVYGLGVLAGACFRGKPPRAWRPILRRATVALPSERYPDVAAFDRAVRRRHAPAWIAAAAVLAASLAAALPALFRPEPDRRLPELVARFAESAELRNAASFDLLGNRPHATVALGGRTVSLAEPLRFGCGAVVEIVGPGRLEAAVGGTADDLVVLRGATLVDRTEDPDPAHSPRFRLEAGGYLVLPGILSLHARDWAEPYAEPDPFEPKPDDRAVRFGDADPDLRAQLLVERGLLSDERVRAAADGEIPAPELGALLFPDAPDGVVWTTSSLHPWKIDGGEPGAVSCDLPGGYGESRLRMRTDRDVALRLRYAKNFAGAADHGGRGGVFEMLVNGDVGAADAADGRLSDGWEFFGRDKLQLYGGSNDVVFRFRSDSRTLPGHFNGVLLRAVPEND